MGIALDRATRRYGDGRVLVGGSPRRVLRLSAPGAAAVDALQAGEATTPVVLALGRQLIDAGLAHPEPATPRFAPSVTVVIPVRDRAPELDRCLTTLGPRGRRNGRRGRFEVLVVDDGSSDAAAIRAVCAWHGTGLLRLPRSEGPAAARNAALAWVSSELVAFLDSDCVAPANWVAELSGYFDDPRVGAVAPRVRSLVGRGFVGRYAAARSPLDMGERPCAVAPGNVVSYVPTAALVVRRAALGEGFDPALRYGEDVDLVWRLSDGGWRVRYVPAVEVDHEDPEDWRTLLRRRWAYGSSAGPLAERHGARLAPVVLQPAATVAAALLLTRRPGAAALVTLARSGWMAHRLRSSGVPVRWAGPWTLQTLARTLDGLARTGTILAAPALLTGMLVPSRVRTPLVLLAVGSGAASWWREGRGHDLDPLRWTLASWLDDAAYGAGVWSGSVRSRTPWAVLPAVGGSGELRRAWSVAAERVGALRDRAPAVGRRLAAARRGFGAVRRGLRRVP